MADTTERDKKRRRAGQWLFLPLLSLRGSIGRASDDIEDAFDVMYDAYEAEQSVAGALAKGHTGMMSAFTTLIGQSLSKGFKAGAKISGSSHTPNFTTLAQAQARRVVGQMGNASSKWMHSGGSDGFVFSRDRAERAAKYTAAEAFFNGMAKAFAGSDEEFEKAWITTSDDPCDDCLENEDEGFIPMEEDFSSGHYAPLLHPNCQCYLEVRKARIAGD